MKYLLILACLYQVSAFANKEKAKAPPAKEVEQSKTQMVKEKIKEFFSILEFDRDAVIEYHTKNLSNTNTAKNDLGQDWNNENLNLLYINADFDLVVKDYKFKGTWFFRESSSQLYGDDFLALNHALYPQKIITRDLFKMQYRNETSSNRTESILNQFWMEMGDEEFHFKLGRFYIDYGEGEIINPINPYNLAGSFEHHSRFSQGNDGMQVKIQKNPKLALYIYLLGDRSYELYRDEKITRTLMLRGIWQYKPDTEITYILGEDQRRHKYGLQVKKSFDSALFYLQSVRFSQKLDQSSPSEKGLFHYLVGGEYDFNKKWTTRAEWGKFESSDNISEAFLMNHSYIAMQNVMAWINEYRFDDTASIKLTYAKDASSGFSFYRLEKNMKPKKDTEFFSYILSRSSSATNDETLNSLQNSIGQEVGFGFRFYQ